MGAFLAAQHFVGDPAELLAYDDMRRSFPADSLMLPACVSGVDGITIYDACPDPGDLRGIQLECGLRRRGGSGGSARASDRAPGGGPLRDCFPLTLRPNRDPPLPDGAATHGVRRGSDEGRGKARDRHGDRSGADADAAASRRTPVTGERVGNRPYRVGRMLTDRGRKRNRPNEAREVGVSVGLACVPGNRRAEAHETEVLGRVPTHAVGRVARVCGAVARRRPSAAVAASAQAGCWGRSLDPWSHLVLGPCV